jgi:hypothetical protein
MSKLIANMSEMGDRSNSYKRCRNTHGSNSGRAIKSTEGIINTSQIQILVEFLLNYINSKIPPIIIYTDLVGSTNTSMTLPVDKMVAIILAFTYEFSSIIGVM